MSRHSIGKRPTFRAIPPPAEVHRQLYANRRERILLQQLLKLATSVHAGASQEVGAK